MKVSPGWIDSLGLHVWLVPRWHWRLAPPAFKERLPESVKDKVPSPAMWRPARLRHIDHIDPSGIRWRRGRGVIGRCWLRRQAISFSLQADWGAYRDYDAKQWKALRRDPKFRHVTMKLNFEQFQRMQSLYSEVLAVPIYKQRESGNRYLVGCVVADMPALKDGQSPRFSILNSTFETLLRTCAAQLEDRIKA